MPQLHRDPSRRHASIVKLILTLVALLPGLHSHPTIVGVQRHGHIFSHNGGWEEEPGSPSFWWKLIIIGILVLTGGVFAGLTLGLMGLDAVNLQVLEASGTPHERSQSRKVLKLLNRGKHWVLVTLLLSNVVVNETLPIIMDSVFGGGWPAVVASTALIVIFGEIIPQAFCVRYGLSIGSKCTYFVLLLMYAMYPIAYPIAMLLDHVLGEDSGTVYRKGQLKTFVSLHGSLGEAADRLNEDEVTIIGSVLELNEKPVDQVMTPIDDVYVLGADHVLDQETIDEIQAAGYSRIPIHQPNDASNYIGMLLVKSLISYDPADSLPVSSFALSALPETKPDTTCLDILNFFQEGRSHMVLVTDNPGANGGALGIITLEDVIEELIGEEIIDETDVFVDVHNKIRVMRTPTTPKTKKRIAPLLRNTRTVSKDRRSAAYPVVTATMKGKVKIKDMDSVLLKPGNGHSTEHDGSANGSQYGSVSTVRGLSDNGPGNQSNDNDPTADEESRPLLR